ncbi:hypothetical protein, partial [Actinomyces naeslundii]|uniref:hypothetical protein n=1 Tax=Actinomyces naeslundii TaxID=1655 RepID=UPI00209362A0
MASRLIAPAISAAPTSRTASEALRRGHLLHETAQRPGGDAHQPGPVDDAHARGLGDLLGRPV